MCSQVKVCDEPHLMLIKALLHESLQGNIDEAYLVIELFKLTFCFAYTFRQLINYVMFCFIISLWLIFMDLMGYASYLKYNFL